MWSHDECVDVLAGALLAEEARLRAEQAVYGLDALDEVAIHPVLARACASAGRGVLREQAYPTTWKKRTWRAGGGEDLPLPRERERCDLVLTERAGLAIADDVRVRKRRRDVGREAAGTLFETAAETTIARGLVDEPEETVPAGEAFWIEVKALGQFEYCDGVPGPNPSYGSRLTRSVVGDIGKLAGDDEIAQGGALIVLFTADEATAEHDLLLVAHRCLDRQLPIAGPVRRSVPILDRIGNGVCSVVMFPVKK